MTTGIHSTSEACNHAVPRPVSATWCHAIKTRKFRLVNGCCLALLVCILTGCGGGLSPVTGKVTNGDSPLTTGSVTFHPDKEKGNNITQQPRAEIGENGEYKLYTDGKEGAPAGSYKVTVMAQAVAEGADPYGPQKFLVREDYTKVETTPLSIEVKDDAPQNYYDIKLEKK
jgi:hypothetical protein